MSSHAATEAPRVRQCTQCGAALELVGSALSTACAYCDAPTVDAARAVSHLDAVAPFRVTREIASSKLGAFLRGKFWAPGAVKSLAVAGASLRGVLVPHWAFEGVVRSRYDGRVGIYYYVTERYKDSEGRTRTRQRRETEWFPLAGTAARQIEGHLVSASLGLAEVESNAIEPFDLGWAVPFDARLVSGFEAEVPTVERERAVATAVEELRRAEAARIEAELMPGDRNEVYHVASEVEVRRSRAVLLPVWIGVYTHDQRTRRLLVNGQTGRCAGEVPVSKIKIALAVLVGVALVAAIVLAIWWGGQR